MKKVINLKLNAVTLPVMLESEKPPEVKEGATHQVDAETRGKLSLVFAGIMEETSRNVVIQEWLEQVKKYNPNIQQEVSPQNQDYLSFDAEYTYLREIPEVGIQPLDLEMFDPVIVTVKHENGELEQKVDMSEWDEQDNENAVQEFLEDARMTHLHYSAERLEL